MNFVSDRFSHSALRVYLSDINRYLKYHKIRLDLTDLELPQNLQEERYAISIEEIEKILEISSFNKRGFYLALISTGARPVEILGLRKSDIEFLDGKYKATIPAFLTKKKMARTIFFSSEVTPYLARLLKNCKNNTPFTRSKTSELGRVQEHCYRDSRRNHRIKQ